MRFSDGQNLRINLDRLFNRIDVLAEIGAIDGGGVCRMALSDEERQGRDLVVSWMREIGLNISVDRIGNVIASGATVSVDLRNPNEEKLRAA